MMRSSVSPAVLLLLLVAVSSSIEEGAASSSSSSLHGHRRRGGYSSPPRRQHPEAMWSSTRDGSSPNLDMYVNNDNSASYYERNSMNPPPLISRAKRRQLQSNNIGEGTDNKSSMSDLDLIVEETKLGNDALTRLRRDLLWDSYYDKHAYPFDYAWYGQKEGSRTGVPIELDINFHRVFSVDTINPVLDLVVWFRLEWADPRLTWNPQEYGNMTKVWFWIADGGAGGEVSEIWTPDIELWNLETELGETLGDSYAIVNNDGSIYWTRPGHLRPSCKFYGLSSFPFDKLTCTMEFGSWTFSGKYMRLVMGGSDGDGFSLGGSETAGSSYNEFGFVREDPISCVEVVYPPYPASPEEDWPVLMYNVTIERSWQPYARGYILLQVMLNVVGFSAFWLPPSCGERMGLSITAMLAAVASDLVVASNLPAAAELTWFQKFSITSLVFAFISLLESVAVLYFFYKRTDTIIPHWYSFARDWVIVKKAARGKDVVLRKGSELVATIGHGVQEISAPKRGSDVSHRAAAVDESFDENGDRKKSESKDDGNHEITSSALKGIPEDTSHADLDCSNASLSVRDIDFGVVHVKKKSEGNRDNPLAASFVSTLSNDDDPLQSPKVPAEKVEVHSLVTSRSKRLSIPEKDNYMQENQSVLIPRDADDVSLYFVCLKH